MTDYRVLTSIVFMFLGIIISIGGSNYGDPVNALTSLISVSLLIISMIILPPEIFSRKTIRFRRVLLIILVPFWLLEFVRFFI